MASTGNTKVTDMEQLVVLLDSLGVPRSHYSLGRHRDERTCLVEDSGLWQVYYAERGQTENLHEFFTFEEAKRYLLKELLP